MNKTREPNVFWEYDQSFTRYTNNQGRVVKVYESPDGTHWASVENNGTHVNTWKSESYAALCQRAVDFCAQKVAV
jgi:hypothetical protein